MLKPVESYKLLLYDIREVVAYFNHYPGLELLLQRAKIEDPQLALLSLVQTGLIRLGATRIIGYHPGPEAEILYKAMGPAIEMGLRNSFHEFIFSCNWWSLTDVRTMIAGNTLLISFT